VFSGLFGTNGSKMRWFYYNIHSPQTYYDLGMQRYCEEKEARRA
jgi:hypothetical protein